MNIDEQMKIARDQMQIAARYFENLSGRAREEVAIEDVKATLEADGYWHQHDEWRISTVTSSRIEPVERDGRTWFRVSVRCDHEFACHCPTLERAVEFVGIYKLLISDLFGTLGWPSWATRQRMDP